MILLIHETKNPNLVTTHFSNLRYPLHTTIAQKSKTVKNFIPDNHIYIITN